MNPSKQMMLMKLTSFLAAAERLILRFWYVLPLLAAVLLFILILLTTTYPSILENIIYCLLLLTLMMLAVSWCVLLANKKWWRCIVSVVVSVVFVGVLGFYLSFAAMSAPDGFGRDHPIPEGLTYNLPLQRYHWDDSLAVSVVDTDSVVTVDTLNADTYLQIWDGIQGGIYLYDFYYGPLPAGEIYLRCFEVTENIPLSESRISEDSRAKIRPTTAFSKVVDKQKFTIYEGDFYDYYAARIEVWFKDADTKKERKLMEKMYRVEGWMR